jgi:predicted nuclease with RNAse H fold
VNFLRVKRKVKILPMNLKEMKRNSRKKLKIYKKLKAIIKD